MKTTVLVVDDNPTNLKLACDLLAMEGYDGLRAAEAEQARTVLGDSTIDIILMDIELPGTDGLTLTRVLKADERTKEIPIVALTAFAMKGDDQKAFEAGCVGYIAKPIDTRQFCAQVAKYLIKM